MDFHFFIFVTIQDLLQLTFADLTLLYAIPWLYYINRKQGSNELMITHEILPFQFIEMSKFIAFFAYRKVHKKISMYKTIV